MGTYYLLKHTPPGVDPLGPENTLSLMVGVLTGAPISGQSRVSATAKSPVTGLIGDSQAGGFWPAELKAAGFDGIVVHGRAERPVYLWVHDGEAELRDAAHLWGRFTGDVEDTIREELGDRRIQVLAVWPGRRAGGALRRADQLCQPGQRAHRHGRRDGAPRTSRRSPCAGTSSPEVADPEALKALARWGVDALRQVGRRRPGQCMGTAADRHCPADGRRPAHPQLVRAASSRGTRRSAARPCRDTILKERDTCFGCVVRCKRVVEIDRGAVPGRSRATAARSTRPWPRSAPTAASRPGGGLRAPTSSATCTAWTRSRCGATIAWAMDCFEQGLITAQDTGGIELRFGNAEAMVQMVELIGEAGGLRRPAGGGFRARGRRRWAWGRRPGRGRSRTRSFPPTCRRSSAAWRSSTPSTPSAPTTSRTSTTRPTAGHPDPHGSTGPARPAAGRRAERGEGALCALHGVLLQLLDSVSVCQFVWGPAWQLYGPDQLVEAGAGGHGLGRQPVGADEGRRAAAQHAARLQRARGVRRGGGYGAAQAVQAAGGRASDGVAVTAEEVEAAKRSITAWPAGTRAAARRAPNWRNWRSAGWPTCLGL